MLTGNQIEKAFVKNKIAEPLKVKRKSPKHKQFKCHKCGKPMIIIENTNTMACDCGQYYVFDPS